MKKLNTKQIIITIIGFAFFIAGFVLIWQEFLIAIVLLMISALLIAPLELKKKREKKSAPMIAQINENMEKARELERAARRGEEP